MNEEYLQYYNDVCLTLIDDNNLLGFNLVFRWNIFVLHCVASYLHVQPNVYRKIINSQNCINQNRFYFKSH